MYEDYIVELGYYRNGEVIEGAASQEWLLEADEKKISAEQTSL